MVRQARGPLFMAVVAFLASVTSGRGEQPALPAAPIPVNPSAPAIDGPVIAPRPLPPQPVPSGLVPPACAPFEDHNGPLLKGDPLLDPLEVPPGFFAGVEIDLVAPHIKNRLQSSLPFPAFLPGDVHLPTAELDWVGSPRFELGYRFAGGLG